MTLPARKRLRLKGYDYSQPGSYFVTVCTLDKKCTLGKVCVGPDALIGPRVHLTALGEKLNQVIAETPKAYPNVDVQYIIMPNHFHAVFVLRGNGPMGSSGPTLGMIVRGIKMGVTRWAGYSVWQDGYYEHIIRNDEDCLRVLAYMRNNPARWLEK